MSNISRGSISVSETTPTNLPGDCPTRHINSDGTFCIAYKAGEFSDATKAALWWEHLHSFLTLQETASERQKWPKGAELAHGNQAAQIQLDLESLCFELGQDQNLQQALHYKSGPLEEVSQQVRKSDGYLLNGRAECCSERKRSKKHPLLRRECKKHNLSCPARMLYDLRQAEKAFWESYSQSKCCGTMLDCPLLDKNKLVAGST